MNCAPLFPQSLWPSSLTPFSQKSVPVARRAPLLWDALALFVDYWTASEGTEVHIHTHNAVNLLRHTTSEWRTNLLRAKASAAHATELKTQVAVLNSKLTNPVTKKSATHTLKASRYADTAPQEHHSVSKDP